MANVICPACGRENRAGAPACRCGADLTTEVEIPPVVVAGEPVDVDSPQVNGNDGPEVAGQDVACPSPGCTFVFSEGIQTCEFCGEVRPGAEARLISRTWRVSGPGIEIAVGPGERVVLGRQGDHPEGFAKFGNVGRRHAELHTQDDGSVVVTDLNSRNGTFVEGERLPAGGTHRSGAAFELRLAAHLVLRVEVRA